MEDLEKHERFVSISSPSSEGGEITALGFIIGFFVNNYLFPLVLLQAKAVRTIFQTGKFSRLQRVSISSPSSEGGEFFFHELGDSVIKMTEDCFH